MREKKEINVRIGEQVKYAREKAGLSQERFAERIDVSPQYISDLERGVVGISIPTLKRLCVVLGVTSDQILFGDRPADDRQALLRRCEQLTEKQFSLLLRLVDTYMEAFEQ